MAIAAELTIDTSATAMDMAQAIFGSGIEVTGASFAGAASGSSGIYSGAQTTIPGMVAGDSGVILSTGRVTDLTNSNGSTNTNTAAGTSTNTTGVDGDPDLNEIAGRATFDGAILTASFIPDGDFLTMQFVFASEEYPEYVGSNFNDAFGVWINGDFIPLTTTGNGEVAVNTVNATTNHNLYQSNTADQLNTEMDGMTRVLSFKAPVNSGQVNTIRIGIADAGDAIYDSNLLIAGESVQTYALAFDDDIQLQANASRTFDILANDNDQVGGDLTITHINGVAVVPGQSVTLLTGETVRLNADGTVTVTSDGDLGSTNLTYSVIDGDGNTDVGFITITTVAAAGKDGIIEGTAGDDVIQTGYLGDPDGDLVDGDDALGVGGTTGDGDYIVAGAGDDSILSGAGDDVVYAGADNDTVFGGAGDDSVALGAGDDAFGSVTDESAGDDTVSGDAGDDAIFGGDGTDSLYGGTGDDTLSGGSGADTMAGEDDSDLIFGGAGDTVDGGEGGAVDADALIANDVLSVAFDPDNSENGTITFVDSSTLTFQNIETLILNGGNPDGIVWGTDAGQVMDVGYVDANGDIIDGEDALFPGAAPNDDEVFGQGGADTITSGLGDDDVYGGDADDRIATGAGNDYAQGDAGNDTLDGGADDDFLRGDAGNDQVFGGIGNDTVYGGADDDVVDAGAGNDSAFGGFGSDLVYGGDGSDTITGSGGNDQVFGGDGDDTVQGSDGADTLYGGLGADRLLGEDDGDTIYAGAGDHVDGYENVTTGVDLDRLYVTDVTSVTFDPFLPENGRVTFTDGGTLDFYNIEQVYVDGVLFGQPDYRVEGSAADDLIDADYDGDLDGDRIDAADNQTGTDADLVLAGAGDDTVLAGAGDDEVQGDGGDDLLFGGDGADTLSGGDGADTLDGGADRDVILGAVDDVVDGGEDGDDFDTLDLRGAGAFVFTADPDNAENGTVEFVDSGRTLTFTNIENVIHCFTPGSRVLTDAGEVAVQDLRRGDRVLTRDDGFQEIRWMAQRDLNQAELRRTASFNPVRIAKGSLGDGVPERDLVVSPQHRMLITGPRAELLFGEHEVLVAATHLIGLPGVTRIFPMAISYIHFLFDAHQIVRADGAWSESFQPGALTVAGLADPQRAELLALFPDVLDGTSHCAARMSLKAREAAVLLRA